MWRRRLIRCAERVAFRLESDATFYPFTFLAPDQIVPRWKLPRSHEAPVRASRTLPFQRVKIHFDLRRGNFLGGLIAVAAGATGGTIGNRAFSMLSCFRSLIIISRTLALPFRMSLLPASTAFRLKAARLDCDQLRNFGGKYLCFGEPSILVTSASLTTPMRCRLTLTTRFQMTSSRSS